MSGPLIYIPEPEHASVLQDKKPNRPKPLAAILIPVAAFALALMFGLAFVLSAPQGFPGGSVFVVDEGATLSGVASKLSDAHALRSPSAFKALVSLFGGRGGLRAGDYALEEPQNALVLSWRFARGSYGLVNVRVTIPEGTAVSEIPAIFAKSGSFTKFEKAEFLRLARPKEGYLFPDTYLFLPNVTAGEVVDAMSKNYERKVGPLRARLLAFGKSESDVIKMASIVEEEARTDMSRRIIAGILWKRLAEGMPLQVDAAFSFVNGKKDSSLISLDDLKIDSPYNTYVYKGLPPTPISNPGLAAIEATIKPMSTPYYFYLSDKDGEMRYAVTHDEHVANKERYLR